MGKIAIVVATIPCMSPTSKQISFQFHWDGHHFVNNFVIQNIESESNNAYFF